MRILKLLICRFTGDMSSNYNFSRMLYKNLRLPVLRNNAYEQNYYFPSRFNYFCNLPHYKVKPQIVLTQIFPLRICNSACTLTPISMLKESNKIDHTVLRSFFSSIRNDSDEKEKMDVTEILNNKTVTKISQKDKLKRAVRDYGATVIVFHVTISLASLGICYLAISSGVNIASVLSSLGFSEAIINSKIAASGSTFVVSYAVHKLFAPLRIAITLSATPLIVRYLRKIGFLKPPKS